MAEKHQLQRQPGRRIVITPPDHLEEAQRSHWIKLANDIPEERLKTRAQLYLLELASRHAASIDFLSTSIVQMEKQQGIITDKEWWTRYREAVQTRSQESKALTATLTQLMQSDRWALTPISKSKWQD